jgi:hypothetical protein
MATAELIAAVRAHALANYETDGWDYVVECWDDEELSESIGSATTPKEAIEAVHKQVKIMGDYRAEIESTAF